MAFSARRRFSHWPLIALLCTLFALSGCRSDGNLSGIFPGSGSDNTDSTAVDGSSAGSGTVIRDPEPPANDPEPGTPAEEEVADETSGGSLPVAGKDPIQVPDRPTLSWDSPLTREDGSKLYPGEISGYKIYFRLRHEQAYQTVSLDGPETTSLSLDSFRQGAYEFAVSAVDHNGLESRRSDAIPVDLI